MDRGGGRFPFAGRGDGRNGGRGFGRGRGGPRNNFARYDQKMRTVPNASKSPYLNFPIGSAPSPGDVQRFMAEFAVAAALHCPKSGVAKVIRDDGTILDDYIIREEPAIPEAEGEDADPDAAYIRMRWGNQIKAYDKWVEDFNEEKRTMIALIKSHLGSDSLARVRETEAGRNAIENDDPRALLAQIYTSHNTDHLMEHEHNVVLAERRLHSVQLGEKEGTGMYFNRFKALVQATKDALTNNGDDPDARMPSEANLAVMFIMGLNAGYRRFKSSFTDGTNEEGYPDTLNEAYRRSLKATTDMITYRMRTVPYAFKGLFVAGRGNHVPQGRGGGRNHRGGRGGRNYGGGRVRGPRLCYVCRQPGHIAAQCPHRDDAVIDEAVAQMNGDDNAEN